LNWIYCFEHWWSFYDHNRTPYFQSLLDFHLTRLSSPLHHAVPPLSLTSGQNWAVWSVCPCLASTKYFRGICCSNSIL
jgi:hypothetical protein